MKNLDATITRVYQVTYSDKIFKSLGDAVRYIAELNKMAYTPVWDLSNETDQDLKQSIWEQKADKTLYAHATHENKKIMFYNVHHEIRILTVE